MVKKCLSYCLVLMIAMQSFVTMAATTASQQLEELHSVSSNEHKLLSAQETDPALDVTSSQSDFDEFDCHHCGHCHGSHVSVLHSTSSPFVPFYSSPTSNEYDKTVLSGLINNLFRPPKV